MTEIIRVDIYKRDVLVHCGNLKPLRKYLSKFLSQDAIREICDSLRDCKLGQTLQIKGSGILVYLPKEPSDAKDMGTLVHELFHAAYFILQKAGIDCNDSADEAYAYLLQFLSEKVFTSFSFPVQSPSRSDASSHIQAERTDRCEHPSLSRCTSLP